MNDKLKTGLLNVFERAPKVEELEQERYKDTEFADVVFQGTSPDNTIEVVVTRKEKRLKIKT